jgi:hypothetical protein
MNLVGKYKLLRHGTYDSSELYTTSSKYLAGELHYGEDKHLSVMIHFVQSPMSLSEILSYVGKFEVISNTIINHDIYLSSAAKLNNTVEKRLYKIDGNLLYLGKNLSMGRFEAVWEKCD